MAVARIAFAVWDRLWWLFRPLVWLSRGYGNWDATKVALKFALTGTPDLPSNRPRPRSPKP
jgi:hypothetical protein